MKSRHWMLVSLLAALGLIYVVYFTEWLRPAPIEIASQVRFAVQPPRFGRAPRKPRPPGNTPLPVVQDRIVRIMQRNSTNRLPEGAAVQVFGPGQQPDGAPLGNGVKYSGQPQSSNGLLRVTQPVKAERLAAAEQVERVGRPETGSIDQAPGGVANVTFSLDAWYQLTRLRVEDVPVDGSAPHVLWQLVGKSLPLNSLLYGRNPEGMSPILAGATFEPLLPGIPYRLIIEAGRRSGTNNFTTIELNGPP